MSNENITNWHLWPYVTKYRANSKQQTGRHTPDCGTHPTRSRQMVDLRRQEHVHGFRLKLFDAVVTGHRDCGVWVDDA